MKKIIQKRLLNTYKTAIATSIILIGTNTAQAVPITFLGDLSDGNINSGMMAVDSLSTPSLWDFWTFSANAGDNITVTGLRDPSGSDHDPILSVWFGTELDTSAYTNLFSDSTSTTIIGTGDDNIADPGPYGDPQVSFSAINSGMYTIAIAEHTATFDGLGTLCADGVGNSCEYNIDVQGSTAVSAPGTIALLGLGIAGLGFTRRKTS